MPGSDHGSQRRTSVVSASVKSRAAHFTECPPKPFEAAVGRILDGLDMGANQAFAAGLGKSPAWVSRVKDPHDPTHIRASEVAHVCQLLGTTEPLDLLFDGRRIGGFERRMGPVPDIAPAEDLRLDAMEAAGSLGTYLAHLGRALVDGHLDGPELADLESLLVDLQEQIGGQLAAIRGRRGAR